MTQEYTTFSDISRESLDKSDDIVYANTPIQGVSLEVVEQISRSQNEPQWMLDIRKKALEVFLSRPMPTWGPSLESLDLDSLYYFAKPE